MTRSINPCRSGSASGSAATRAADGAGSRRRAAARQPGLLIFLAAAVLLLCPGRPFGAVRTDYSRTIAEMTERVRLGMAETGAVGLAITLVDGDEAVWTAGFGYADRRNGVPVTGETVFLIGSISKTMAGTAVMQLAERGLVDIDRPFSEFLPAFSLQDRFPGSVITPRSILDHHSGVPGDLFNGLFTLSPDEGYNAWLADYLQGDYPQYPVNQIYSYSNSGYSLLTDAVARVSGQSFTDFTQSRIFAPLGMGRTSFAGDRPDIQAALSKAYRRGAEYPGEFVNGPSAGSVRSTAADMARYIRAVLAGGQGDNGRILDPATLQEMLRPQNRDLVLDRWAVSNGLSWFVQDMPEPEFLDALAGGVAFEGVPGGIMGFSTPFQSWTGAAGAADLATGAPMQPDMQVRLASITKMFTATLVMKLVEEGILSVDDTVEEWLPGAIDRGGEITIHMLLNHTSGLKDHEDLEEFWDRFLAAPTVGWTEAEVLALIRGCGYWCDPGQEWHYSNSGYYLLGMIVERAAQATVEEEIQRRFFGPLGMTRTSLTRSGALTAPFCRSYAFHPATGVLADTTDWNFSWDWTSGSAVSTAADMLTWARALFAGEIVSPETLRRMLTAVPPSVNYGYGLRVRDGMVFPETVVTHSGANPGTSTLWMYMPETGRAFFSAVNRSDLALDADIPPPVLGVAALKQALTGAAEAANGQFYYDRTCQHDGSTSNFNSQLKILRDHRLGVFVTCNTFGSSPLVHRLADECLALAAEDKAGVPPVQPLLRDPVPPVAAGPEELSALAGIYVTSGGFDIFRVRHSESLGWHLEWQPSAGSEPPVRKAMILRADGRFTPADSMSPQLEFLRAGGRDVLNYRLELNGYMRLQGQYEKYVPRPIPAAWLAREGEYVAENLHPVDYSRVIPGDQQASRSLKILVKQGLLLMNQGGTELVLDPAGDDLGFLAGLGRYKGMSVRAFEGPDYAPRLMFAGCTYAPFAPLHKLHLPYVPTGEASTAAELFVANPDSAPAWVKCTARGEAGQVFAEMGPFCVPSGAQNRVPVGSWPEMIWLTLEATGPEVTAAVVWPDQPGKEPAGLDIAGAAPPPARKGYFPAVKATGGCSTAIYLANPGRTVVAASFVGRDATRTYTGPVRRIPAGGVLRADLRDLFGGAAFDGWVTVEADGVVAGRALVTQGGVLSAAANLVPSPDAAESMVAPHVVDMPGLTSELALVNPGEGPAEVLLTLRYRSGSSAEIETVTRTVRVSPGRCARLGGAELGFPQGGSSEGWLQVDSPGAPLTASLELIVPATGQGLLSSPLQAIPAQVFHFAPAADGPEGETLGWTGVALVNPGEESAGVTLAMRDRFGMLLDESRFVLAGGEKIVRFLRDFPDFAGLPSPASGCLRVEASRPVHAMAITGDAAAGSLCAVPPQPAFSDDQKARMTAAIQSRLEQYNAAGAVAAVFAPGRGNFVAAEGLADIDTGRALKWADRIRICSLTKTFTITVILQLAEEGLLSLDEPIAFFLPWVPGGELVTARNLCDHTGGLFSYTEDPIFGEIFLTDPLYQWAPEELAWLGLSHPPYFPPGTGFYYSNTHTILLGMMVEAITGNSVGDEIAARVLHPLGLAHTEFPSGPELSPPYARAYAHLQGPDALDDFTFFDPSAAWAAGGMTSTLPDMLVWCRALAEGFLLTPEMQRERLTWSGFSSESGTESNTQYCLGIRFDGPLLGHTGDTVSYSVVVDYLPDYRAAIVILTNTGGGHVAPMVEDLVNIAFPGVLTADRMKTAADGTGCR